MKILSSLEGTLTSFGGQALDAWAITRSAKHWGVFARVPDNSNKVSNTQIAQGDQANPNVPANGTKLEFNDGSGNNVKIRKILSAAHVGDVDITRKSAISTAPQEDGSFVSYNKVMSPYTITIDMICDGSDTGNIGANLLPFFLRGKSREAPAIKRQIIEALDFLVQDTNLYYVSTPEKIYRNANIIAYEVKRGIANPNGPKLGVDMLAIQLTMQEVRSTQSFRNRNSESQYPQGAPVQNNGSTQPTMLAKS
ncbi:hypothetical protein GS501_04965 [Saccharibacter sp. 17.LH.SD]|uniref:phage baseplate protein n=1 Tax=Saccharibacter sp. 17.LH.SD TaxID=2689393 RepID=UPI00136D1F93|nr:hypothetical protein [Saccharibacter sp. 17.LH.SD]MXV44398.1 hypothetical protein [Saccharibacter sp. 17.LH.SD]